MYSYTGTLILTSSSNCSNPGTHTDQPWLISTLEEWHQTLPTQGGHCSHQTTFHCILLHPNTPGTLRTAHHSALIFHSNHRAKKLGQKLGRRHVFSPLSVRHSSSSFLGEFLARAQGMHASAGYRFLLTSNDGQGSRTLFALQPNNRSAVRASFHIRRQSPTRTGTQRHSARHRNTTAHHFEVSPLLIDQCL